MGSDSGKKTIRVDFRAQYCRCILHKQTVERATGEPVPEKYKKAIEEALPMTEDICDSCMRKGVVK